jgi:hypothetical protein
MLFVAVLAAAAAPSWSAAAALAARHAAPAQHFAPSHRHAHSWMSPAAKSAHNLLYVGNGSTGVVDVFSVGKKGTTLVGQLTEFQSPQGMTTDRAGNLYVVNDYIPQEGPAGGEVDVFPKGATNASLSINPYPWSPFDVGVDKKGNIYIANIAPISEFSPGSVTVYDAAGYGPIRTLEGTNLKEIYGIAVDQRTSDVYVTYTPSLGGAGHIASFRHGKGNANDLGVSFGPSWGIVQDGAGNVLAADGNGPLHIYPQTGGAQVGSISVPGDPLFATFNTDRSLLYVSNFNNFDVEVFRYSDGSMIGTVKDGEWGKGAWPTGVAYWPPAR